MKAKFTMQRKARKFFKSLRFVFLKLNEICLRFKVGTPHEVFIYFLSITRVPVKPPNIHDINEKLGKIHEENKIGFFNKFGFIRDLTDLHLKVHDFQIYTRFRFIF